MAKKPKEKTAVPEGYKLVSVAAIEALAENISTVAQAARAMETRLTRACLVTLIQGKTPLTMGRNPINAVLNALQDLDVYVKPVRTKK